MTHNPEQFKVKKGIDEHGRQEGHRQIDRGLHQREQEVRAGEAVRLMKLEIGRSGDSGGGSSRGTGGGAGAGGAGGGNSGDGRGLIALDEAVHRQQTRALGFDATRPYIGRLEADVADA